MMHLCPWADAIRPRDSRQLMNAVLRYPSMPAIVQPQSSKQAWPLFTDSDPRSAGT